MCRSGCVHYAIKKSSNNDNYEHIRCLECYLDGLACTSARFQIFSAVWISSCTIILKPTGSLNGLFTATDTLLAERQSYPLLIKHPPLVALKPDTCIPD